MFLKRAIHTFRNFIITGTQLAVPLFFTIMCLVVIKTFPGPHNSPPMSLSIDSLGENVVVYSLPDNSSIRPIDSNLGYFYSGQFNYSKATSVQLVNNQTLYRKDPNIINYLLQKADDGVGVYDIKFLVAAGIDRVKDDKNGVNITAFFNNQAFHTPAISLAMAANALYQYIFNDSSIGLDVTNHPLPRTTHDKVRDELSADATGFTIAFNIVFGMSFLASSFALFLIKERATKAKHLQFSSGVSVITFWSATFCWDIINYLMTGVCLVVTIWGFNVEPYVVQGHMVHIGLLFLLYGFAVLPFMYLWSFLFTVPATGYVWLTMFNILSGACWV